MLVIVEMHQPFFLLRCSYCQVKLKYKRILRIIIFQKFQSHPASRTPRFSCKTCGQNQQKIILKADTGRKLSEITQTLNNAQVN